MYEKFLYIIIYNNKKTILYCLSMIYFLIVTPEYLILYYLT
jgi:hypothetical protein